MRERRNTATTFLLLTHYILLVLSVSFGSTLVDKLFFKDELIGIRYSIVVAGLFILVYPVFGWRTRSPWKLVGQWSILKWIFASGIVGLFAFLVDFLVGAITRRLLS